MQVRFAASRATRELCTGVPQAALPTVYAVVLPPMCLNRYYVAEGVRVFSQETWQLLMGNEGRQRVAEHIDVVVPYYISQSKVGVCLLWLSAVVHLWHCWCTCQSV